MIGHQFLHSSVALGRPSQLFPADLQRRNVEHRLRHQLFFNRRLSSSSVRNRRLRHGQPGILRLPCIECRVPDPMLLGQFDGLHASLIPAQQANDPILG